MEPVQIILNPQQAASETEIQKAVANKLQLPFADIRQVRIVRRSVDARQRNIKVLLTVQPVLYNEQNNVQQQENGQIIYQDVHNASSQVIIVGGGPAGLFAALTLLEYGIRPVILERGKPVAERKKDIALLNRNEGMNVESNYCFGEGGAGTFSDGKLFSRSKKRGDMQRVMQIFHLHGASEQILYETHAHIGSDKLPAIIRHMRDTILAKGGEVHFNTKVTGLIMNESGAFPQITGVQTERGITYRGEAVILSIGHSAHDTYRMLATSGVKLEAKGFAMGVRVEHPQPLINRLMYHLEGRDTLYQSSVVSCLGNASYSLVSQVDGRGVYSFCMCPGGHIVPAGTDVCGCVVNGMSASHRNSPYANSGIVVEIQPEDIELPFKTEPLPPSLKGMLFQEYVEQLAAEHGEAPSKAPAQRLLDFVEGRTSNDLPPCSYLPGIVSSRLDLWLPPVIGKRLQQGFRDFNRKYHGYLTNDAVVVGVESRSSSAVRILRNPDTLQHPDVGMLYPAGEGAGYAGGITSSALDGIRVAEQIAVAVSKKSL